MNIVHREIFDKIGVFKAAGDSTAGYHYAIPQSMFDDLIKMGIEDPGRWFVADCSGPCAFPKLRHIGEAIYTILHHRVKSNEEIVSQLVDERATGGGNDVVWDVIHSFAGNAVCNEADAGFVDYNMVIGLITEGYSRGLKKGRKATLVNENKPTHVYESEAAGGTEGTCKFKIVLRRLTPADWSDGSKFVVHFWNTDNDSYNYGIYCCDESDAMQSYIGKCAHYKVNPFPNGLH